MRLQPGHLLKMFRIAVALDLAQIVSGQVHLKRSEVLLQAGQLSRAWDRDDPGLLGQQPHAGSRGRDFLIREICCAGSELGNTRNSRAMVGSVTEKVSRSIWGRVCHEVRGRCTWRGKLQQIS